MAPISLIKRHLTNGDNDDDDDDMVETTTTVVTVLLLQCSFKLREYFH